MLMPEAWATVALGRAVAVWPLVPAVALARWAVLVVLVLLVVEDHLVEDAEEEAVVVVEEEAAAVVVVEVGVEVVRHGLRLGYDGWMLL